MKKTIIVLLLLLLTATAGTALHAQISLEVNVSDLSSGQPLENMEVILENLDIGYRQQKASNAQGKVQFTGLATSGAYQVRVTETLLYYEAAIFDISLRANYNPSIWLQLPRKSEVQLDALTISAANTYKINTTNAEVASELKRQEIEMLPIEGRDITRVLFRLPNVTQATGFYPEAPNVSINGANPLFTNYLIDGMDNNERFLGGQKFAIPVGFAKNITVLSNNFSSEFGLTGNGIVNITSRSGSNNFSGEAFVISRPGPVIDGASPYAQRDLSGNFVKDGFQRYQTGVGLGGAITKDKTFYYLNIEHTTDIKDNRLNTPDLGVNEIVRGTNNFTYISGKIDHYWSSKMRSTLRANVGKVNIDRQGGGLDGGVAFPSAGNQQDRNSVLIAWQNTYIGNNFTAQTNLQYSRFRWNYGRAYNPDSPQVTVFNPSEEIVAVLGHPGFIFDQTENTQQLQQKFTWYKGTHTLKAGFELISADHQLRGGGNVNGNYTVKLTQSQLDALVAQGSGSSLNVSDLPSDVEVLNYNVELRPNAFGKRQNIYSLYVEDQLALTNRLNVVLGLRYDYDNLSRGGSTKADANNIAPRFSFNYTLNNQSSLRGGYGIFYDKISYAVYSDALQQNTADADYQAQVAELVRLGLLPSSTDVAAVIFDGNLGASFPDADYLNGPSSAELQDLRAGVFANERRILNPNGYQNPYTHQISLGYQYQIDDKSLFYVDLVHNRSKNLFRLNDLNAATPYPLTEADNVVVRTQAEADLSRRIPIYEGGFAVINGDTLTGVARSVTISETAGEANYWAASFNLQKDRGVDKFDYRLIYTLSLLENNTEDINFKAQDANNFAAEWGPSINDRRHVINGIFNYYPINALSVSVASLLQSGQPINRIPDAAIYGTTDLNGDGRSFGSAYVGNSDRHPGESRNSDRLPWSNTFDVGLQYNFAVGSGNFILRADVFNAFNAANLSGYSNNATQSNQIQVGAADSGLLVRRNASAPRQFQFSLRYVF